MTHRKHHIALIFALVLTLAAGLMAAGTAFAAPAPAVQLVLTVQRRAAVADAQGRAQAAWVPVDAAGVRPGDVLRYTLTGRNAGDRPVSGLALTQPIPAGMAFVARSAAAAGARVIYSTDHGATFSATPTLAVTTPAGATRTVPAPPASYTDVRWTLPGAVAPGASVQVSCEVKVG